MYLFLNILLILLTLLAVFSLSKDSYRSASIGVIFWNVIIFLMTSSIYLFLESGSLLGMFFVLSLSLIMSFIFLGLYQKESEKILLKMSTVSAAFSFTHLLCIMTFMAEMRDMWWYYSPVFDLFYWNYGEMQIVLTIYMITLFGRSGIMGLRNELYSMANVLGYVRSVHHTNCETGYDKNQIKKFLRRS